MPIRWDLNGETNSLLAVNEITVVGYDELDRKQVRTTIKVPETKFIKLTGTDRQVLL